MAASSVRSSSHGEGALTARSGSAVGKEATSATFVLTPLFAKEKPPSRYATRHETTPRPAGGFAFCCLQGRTGRAETSRRGPDGGHDPSGGDQQVAVRSC